MPQTNKNKRLKEDLKQIVSLFDKYNINYWIDFGTLLGIIRNGDFIPWDDDIDLGCLLSEGNKIYELEDELKSLGWKMFVKHNMVTIIKNSSKSDIFFYTKDGSIIKNEYVAFKNYPILAIDSALSKLHLYFFTYKFETRLSKIQKKKLENISIVIPTSLRQFLKTASNNMWTSLINRKKETCMQKKYVFPLKIIDFEGFGVSVPQNPEKYLESMYGKDWTTPIMYNRFKK